jgi:hypothetical protein
MNYKLIHDSIINRAKSRVLPKEVYTERHHIIPRCMGGSDDKSNLVDLTAKEHFIVHKLLVGIYPDSNELVNAIWCMSNLNNSMGRNYRVGAMEYERLKSKWALILSDKMSGENNPMSGRNPHDVWVEKYGEEEANRLREEKNKRQSKTMKEKGITPEHMAKIIEGNKNKVYTEEYLQNLRERLRGRPGLVGEKNGMFGRTGELHPSYRVERPEHSENMTGEGNPMYGVTVYDLWVKKYGKEEADKRNDVANDKRRNKLKGNKNGKRHKVICKETNVIYETITEAAKAIGMKGVTLNAWLHNPHRNKTTLVLL